MKKVNTIPHWFWHGTLQKYFMFPSKKFLLWRSRISQRDDNLKCCHPSKFKYNNCNGQTFLTCVTKNSYICKHFFLISQLFATISIFFLKHFYLISFSISLQKYFPIFVIKANTSSFIISGNDDNTGAVSKLNVSL